MRSLLLNLLVLSPLAAAAPRRPCGKRAATTSTVIEYVTVTDGMTQDIPTSTVVIPTSSSSSVHVEEPAPPATTASSEPVVTSVSPTPATTDIKQPTKVETTATTTSSSSSSTKVAAVTTPTADAETSETMNGVLAQATPISYKIGATDQCGNSDRLIMPGKPWTVGNSMYGASDMVGTQCTNYEGLLSDGDVQLVKWTSVTDVEHVEDTEDICKGYSNIGVGVNLEYPLNEIKGIPAIYQWNRTIEEDFRGTNLFDFITAPTKGDGRSTATSEFMLWLKIWGDQVPIGWSRGPVETLELYGKKWNLYEGKNPGSGVTVRSMLPEEPFEGLFSGDLKEWLDAMVKFGYIDGSQYVNVGNGGTEIFWGKTTQDVVLALNIDV